jgi:hypothetical protein
MDGFVPQTGGKSYVLSFPVKEVSGCLTVHHHIWPLPVLTTCSRHSGKFWQALPRAPNIFRNEGGWAKCQKAIPDPTDYIGNRVTEVGTHGGRTMVKCQKVKLDPTDSLSVKAQGCVYASADELLVSFFRAKNLVIVP